MSKQEGVESAVVMTEQGAADLRDTYLERAEKAESERGGYEDDLTRVEEERDEALGQVEGFRMAAAQTVNAYQMEYEADQRADKAEATITRVSLLVNNWRYDANGIVGNDERAEAYRQRAEELEAALTEEDA